MKVIFSFIYNFIKIIVIGFDSIQIELAGKLSVVVSVLYKFNILHKYFYADEYLCLHGHVYD